MELDDVSVVVTSHNDSNGIRRCLESVDEFGDKLLVDSFSTDGTVEIAREFPVIIYRRASQTEAEQKNWAAAKAGSKWVLLLDASESISPALRGEIKSADASEVAGFSARRSIEYLGRILRSVPKQWSKTTLLFTPSSSRFVQRGTRAVIETEGKIRTLEKPLHRAWHLDVYSHLESINRETTVRAREYVQRRGRLAPPLALMKMLLLPTATFAGRYFLRLGIRDGARGLVLCLLAAYAAFITNAKAWEYARRKDK